MVESAQINGQTVLVGSFSHAPMDAMMNVIRGAFDFEILATDKTFFCFLDNAFHFTHNHQ